MGSTHLSDPFADVLLVQQGVHEARHGESGNETEEGVWRRKDRPLPISQMWLWRSAAEASSIRQRADCVGERAGRGFQTLPKLKTLRNLRILIDQRLDFNLI